MGAVGGMTCPPIMVDVLLSGVAIGVEGVLDPNILENKPPLVDFRCPTIRRVEHFLR